MTARSLCDFINSFAANGRTEEGYGNYYTISGPTTDVLLYFNENYAQATITDETVQVVLLRTKTPDDKLVIFYSGKAIQSKRRSDVYAPSDAAKKYAEIAYEIPSKVLSVDEDLSNLRITNQNGKNLLIELPSGKYLIVCIPSLPVRKAEFLTFIPKDAMADSTSGITRDKNYIDVIVPVSSTTTLASITSLVPEWVKEDDIFTAGVWLINQGKAEIEGFNPTPEEVTDFCNKPTFGMEAPYYDSLLSAAQEQRANFELYYEYGVPYNGDGTCQLPELLDKVDAYRNKAIAWKDRADKFVHKYIAFDKKLFIGGSQVLSSSPRATAQYYNDDVHSYIKGILSPKSQYDRSITTAAAVLTTWYQIYSIIGKNSQILTS